MPVFSQSHTTDISVLQSRVDSLIVVQKTLKKHLEETAAEIDEARQTLSRLRFEEAEQVDLVLMTNMEASIRLQPSPGARVVRIVPEKTPLAAIDYQGAYWKVRHEGLEGWVMRLFVDEGDGADAFKERVLSQASEKELVDSWLDTKNRRAERIGKDMLITDFGMHPPNSAGGVSLFYAFEHLDSTRTIREVAFSMTPYNAEGLIEKGKNSGVTTRRLRRFGPISVHDGERQYQFDNVWYNDRIDCVQIDRIDVSYTDGSRTSYGRSVQDLLARGLNNDCTVPPAETIAVEEQE